jgi:hypothetical protein
MRKRRTCWYGCQLSVHQPQLSCLHLDQHCADWPRGDTVCATAGFECPARHELWNSCTSNPPVKGTSWGARWVTGTLRCTELVRCHRDQFIGSVEEACRGVVHGSCQLCKSCLTVSGGLRPALAASGDCHRPTELVVQPSLSCRTSHWHSQWSLPTAQLSCHKPIPLPSKHANHLLGQHNSLNIPFKRQSNTLRTL